MISSKEQTQKRMLGTKALSPKNPKLGSMARIANRSPTNRFDNKTPITTTTLSSKKQLLQTQQRPQVREALTSGIRIPKTDSVAQVRKSTYNQQSKGGLYAEKNGFHNSNIPQRYEVRPAVNKYNVEEVTSVTNVQYRKNEGEATVSLPNGDSYTGQINNHRYNGKGQYFFKAHSLTYKGDFKDGKQHGQGILFNNNTGEVIYDGLWEYGAKHGSGNYIYSQDQYYNGEWKNNQKDGTGFFSFRGGSYNGQWIKNRASGKGNLKLSDGTEFKGRFDSNQFMEGTVKYPNGDEYYGSMKNNKRNSEDSSYINYATKIRYKGGYFNDKKHGKGVIFYENGDQMSGMFREGQLNQYEVASYKWMDATVFQGWLKGGKPHKGTVTYPNGQKTQI